MKSTEKRGPGRPRKHLPDTGGAKEKRGPGRPRQYASDGPYGAPQLLLRLEPELMEWVRAQGGQAFVREMLERAHKRAQRGTE